MGICWPLILSTDFTVFLGLLLTYFPPWSGLLRLSFLCLRSLGLDGMLFHPMRSCCSMINKISSIFYGSLFLGTLCALFHCWGASCSANWANADSSNLLASNIEFVALEVLKSHGRNSTFIWLRRPTQYKHTSITIYKGLELKYTKISRDSLLLFSLRVRVHKYCRYIDELGLGRKFIKVV